MNKRTKEIFLSNVKNHSMKVILNDGVHRHISFSNNGSQVFRFDLITWPGNLCITGDCGTYVFSRIEDMFVFFRLYYSAYKKTRGEDIAINPGYWSEKLTSICPQGGCYEFSPRLFKEEVKEYFEEWEFNDDPNENLTSEEVKQKVWEDVDSKVLSIAHDGDVRAYDAANNYESEYRHQFIDFWEMRLHEPTHHYIWNLCAIVWGISKFDEEHEASLAGS